MDSFPRTSNEETTRTISVTLDNLSKREDISPIEKVALEALAARISNLPQINEPLEYTPLHQKVISVVNHFFGSNFKLEEKLAPLFSFFLDQAKATESILSTSSGDRNGILLAAEPFIEERTNEYSVISILSAIAKIPDSERDVVCKAAQSFIKERMNGYDVVSILNAITTIPEPERDCVFKEAKLFIKDWMNASEVVRMLYEILAIPASERTDLCLAAASENPNAGVEYF